MILVTVGTQFGFDRLIRWMDDWSGRHKEVQVVAQIGRGEFIPQHMEWSRDISPSRFECLVHESEKVVSHAGMGTIISARLAGKPVIVVPRRASLNEHRNEHQLATAGRLSGSHGIYVAHEDWQLHAQLASHVEGGKSLHEDQLSRLLANLSRVLNSP